MVKENITLYFQQGSSDKFYTASIEGDNEEYIVPFTYGRRGSSGQSGCKTQSPVPYEAAKKIYDKLIKSKAAKGYIPGSDGTVHVQKDASPVDHNQQAAPTDTIPQLLNMIPVEEATTLCLNPNFCAQEKKDGKRVLLQKKGDSITAYNRKGTTCGFPITFQKDASTVDQDFLIDGEAVGDDYFAFDILSLNNKSIKDMPYEKRYETLKNLIPEGIEHIVTVPSTVDKKKELMESLKSQGREGIVFKDLNATYKPGRPNTGGDQLKFKFYDTASCIVEKINAKRSIALAIMGDNGRVSIGNCTIPPNKEIPALNEVVEIRYLYAYKGGSLYQPTFLNTRDDLNETDCLQSQLKYKVT